VPASPVQSCTPQQQPQTSPAGHSSRHHTSRVTRWKPSERVVHGVQPHSSLVLTQCDYKELPQRCMVCTETTWWHYRYCSFATHLLSQDVGDVHVAVCQLVVAQRILTLNPSSDVPCRLRLIAPHSTHTRAHLLSQDVSDVHVAVCQLVVAQRILILNPSSDVPCRLRLIAPHSTHTRAHLLSQDVGDVHVAVCQLVCV
jgi:hypothetical protein